MTAEAFAPAKINLALHVTGRRADGYHLLDSLVVFADVGDRIQVSESTDLTLRVSGPFRQGVPTDDSNLVLKAASLLRNRRGVKAGAHLHLEKHLPHGGGIGGGSSDAAATLKLLADFWAVPPLSVQEALSLGADIPVCLQAPNPTIMRGIGEELMPAPSLPEGWLVLVNRGVVVPTSEVFAALDRLYPLGSPALDPLRPDMDQANFMTWLLGQRNDLAKVVSEDRIAPVVQDVLDTLRPLAKAAEMSGSGSTCWGWFADEAAARSAADQIASVHPEWWVHAAMVLKPS